MSNYAVIVSGDFICQSVENHPTEYVHIMYSQDICIFFNTIIAVISYQLKMITVLYIPRL